MLGDLRKIGNSRRRENAVTLLHSFTTSVALSVGPHPHEQVNVVRLDGQRENVPLVFRAFLLQQYLCTVSYRSHKHWLATARAPDEVVDNQMHAEFIAAVCKVWRALLFHGLIIAPLRPYHKGRGGDEG